MGSDRGSAPYVRRLTPEKCSPLQIAEFAEIGRRGTMAGVARKEAHPQAHLRTRVLPDSKEPARCANELVPGRCSRLPLVSIVVRNPRIITAGAARMSVLCASELTQGKISRWLPVNTAAKYHRIIIAGVAGAALPVVVTVRVAAVVSTADVTEEVRTFRPAPSRKQVKTEEVLVSRPSPEDIGKSSQRLGSHRKKVVVVDRRRTIGSLNFQERTTPVQSLP